MALYPYGFETDVGAKCRCQISGKKLDENEACVMAGSHELKAKVQPQKCEAAPRIFSRGEHLRCPHRFY